MTNPDSIINDGSNNSFMRKGTYLQNEYNYSYSFCSLICSNHGQIIVCPTQITITVITFSYIINTDAGTTPSKFLPIQIVLQTSVSAYVCNLQTMPADDTPASKSQHLWHHLHLLEKMGFSAPIAKSTEVLIIIVYFTWASPGFLLYTSD